MTGSSTRERNFGVEALRILAMLMICVLHTLYMGGILDRYPPDSALYRAAWLMESAAYCGVNCYALISGYVGVKSAFRWSRLPLIWLQVVFYELLICSVFLLYNPTVVIADSWRSAFTPVISNEYWYITAYAGMFALIPLMNSALNSVSRRRLEQSLVFIFVLLVLLQTLSGKTRDFALNAGYSIIWLSVLYLFGGYVRLYIPPIKTNKVWLLLVYVAATLLTAVSKLFGDGKLLSYTSPTVFIAALALLLFFANTRFKLAAARRLVGAVAPAALGVYLIHTHPLVFSYILPAVGKRLSADSLGMLLLLVLGAALAIFVFCSLTDMLRIRLFSLLHINSGVRRLDSLLEDKENIGGTK